MRFEFLILICTCLLISSCADKELHITPKLKSQTFKVFSEDEIDHTLMLIGDAGKVDDKATKYNGVCNAVAKLMKEGRGHSVVFLGDNIYPEGLPKKANPERKDAETSLDAQMLPFENFKKDVYFIPGNHDWRAGLDGIKRQEKYVRKFLDHKKAFIPRNGCSGPEVVELSDNTTMIVIDSEWWIVNWDKEPKINDGCGAQTRQEFINLFTGALKKHRAKTVIIALHHPLYTNGKHSGQFSLKNYFYPIPGFQTLFTLLRKNAGVKQDNLYPAFQQFKRQILLQTAKYDNVIFASGHEHSLQYFEKEHPFIISGSGSKQTSFKLGNGALFGVGKRGYAILDVLKNGDSWVTFYLVDISTGTSTPVFQRQLIKAKAAFEQTEFDQEVLAMDSITTSIYPGKAPGGLKNVLWGELYTDMYYQQVKVPVLKLDQVKGGLFPIKKGGGNQTNSIRLANDAGNQYVIRALIKDASRLNGGAFKGTFIVDLMNTVFTYTNPYAAYTIPPMAKAAGILHTNPQLVYVPKQAALGKFNETFGNELYLFEERVEDSHKDLASFDYPKKIVSTPDMFEKTHKEHDHKINGAHFLRSRLFDLLIGDWDRHEDQWRWVVSKEDGYTYYKA
ncbi:MAG: metallophosphoesterase, partial [Bacteroidota bacterium]